MSYTRWKPYVSVAERRRKAEKAAAKAKQSGANHSPIEPYRGAIAKTFWGKAWCENLEGYGDYANRLPRGRTYVRNGSVIDLEITEGEIQALVMGSSLYTVTISITAVSAKQWQAIGADCAGSIDSLVELLQGKLSTAVMARICTPHTGLFPAPKEIRFDCSCPDAASMCKHIAAVLYGVGARLDQEPELLFRLRQVDMKELVSQAGTGLPKPKKHLTTGKVLENSILADVFGIDMDETILSTKDVRPRKRTASAKGIAQNATSGTAAGTSKKSQATRKAATPKKPVVVKPPTKDSTKLRTLPIKKAKVAGTAPAREKSSVTSTKKLNN